ncbi:MAG: hypothetical protein Tsb0016_02970 [Sphingomonadales bacterium]
MLREWLASAMIMAYAGAATAGADMALPHPRGGDGEACAAQASGPAMRIAVSGFKDNKGNVRVQLYSDKPEEYLAKGAKLRRIEMPAPADEEATAEICVAVPVAGEYAIIVMHDRDGDGKASPFSDGFAVPGVDKMKMRKPTYEEGRVVVGEEIVDIAVNLQYLTGNKRRRGAP